MYMYNSTKNHLQTHLLPYALQALLHYCTPKKKNVNKNCVSTRLSNCVNKKMHELGCIDLTNNRNNCTKTHMFIYIYMSIYINTSNSKKFLGFSLFCIKSNLWTPGSRTLFLQFSILAAMNKDSEPSVTLIYIYIYIYMYT
jgi:hypothetical protein